MISNHLYHDTLAPPPPPPSPPPPSPPPPPPPPPPLFFLFLLSLLSILSLSSLSSQMSRYTLRMKTIHIPTISPPQKNFFFFFQPQRLFTSSVRFRPYPPNPKTLKIIIQEFQSAKSAVKTLNSQAQPLSSKIFLYICIRYIQGGKLHMLTN